MWRLVVCLIWTLAASACFADGFAPAPTGISAAFAPNATTVEIPSREYAARKGNYYVFTTGNGGDFSKGGLPVPAGSYLNARICNVSGGSSGITAQTAYITIRIFDSNGTTAVPYGGIASPAPLTAANTANTAAAVTNGANVVVGGPASSVLQMTFGVGTAPINNAAGNAVPTGVGYVYPGVKNELHELRILPAQTCFGQYVDGLPTALGAATYNLQLRFYGYMD